MTHMLPREQLWHKLCHFIWYSNFCNFNIIIIIIIIGQTFRLEIDILVDIWTCLVGGMKKYKDRK